MTAEPRQPLHTFGRRHLLAGNDHDLVHVSAACVRQLFAGDARFVSGWRDALVAKHLRRASLEPNRDQPLPLQLANSELIALDQQARQHLLG